MRWCARGSPFRFDRMRFTRGRNSILILLRTRDSGHFRWKSKALDSMAKSAITTSSERVGRFQPRYCIAALSMSPHDWQHGTRSPCIKKGAPTRTDPDVEILTIIDAGINSTEGLVVLFTWPILLGKLTSRLAELQPIHI